MIYYTWVFEFADVYTHQIIQEHSFIRMQSIHFSFRIENLRTRDRTVNGKKNIVPKCSEFAMNPESPLL